MRPIQFILLGVILLIIVKTFQKYRAQAISVREFFLWAVFWILVATMVLIPGATQALANLVGIGRGVDLILYLGLTVLFVALFFIFIRIERIERDITAIARKIAFDDKKMIPELVVPGSKQFYENSFNFIKLEWKKIFEGFI